MPHALKSAQHPVIGVITSVAALRRAATGRGGTVRLDRYYRLTEMQARLLGDVAEISRHTSTQTALPRSGTRCNVLCRHLDDVTLRILVALTQSRAVDDGVERE